MEISRDRKFMSVGIIIFLLVILSNFLDSSHKVSPAKAAPPGPVVYLDAGTGCEYLLLPGAGLTPRLAPDGRQRCHVPPAGPTSDGARRRTPGAPASGGAKAPPPGPAAAHS